MHNVHDLDQLMKKVLTFIFLIVSSHHFSCPFCKNPFYLSATLSFFLFSSSLCNSFSFTILQSIFSTSPLFPSFLSSRSMIHPKAEEDHYFFYHSKTHFLERLCTQPIKGWCVNPLAVRINFVIHTANGTHTGPTMSGVLLKGWAPSQKQMVLPFQEYIVHG